MPEVVAIIQARMGSRRLPGKVLMDISGKPMLQQVIERVSQAASLNHIVIATSVDMSDDPIAAFCNGQKYDYFRGSLDDVLERYYWCAYERRADVVVRITGDCPLISPQIIELVGQQFWLNEVSYATNTMPPTFPDGLDCEWMRFDALSQAREYASLKSDREHVTPWIRDNVQGCNVVWHHDLSNYRLCVDEQADLDLVRAIYAELGDNPYWLDVVALLNRRPELVVLNAHIKRNEGMKENDNV